MAIKIKWPAGILAVMVLAGTFTARAEEAISFPQAIAYGDDALYNKDFDRAQKFYEDAAAEKPKEALPHIKLATLYYQKSVFSSALKEFKKAATLHTDSYTKKFLNFTIEKISRNQPLFTAIESASAQGAGADKALLLRLHAEAVLKLQEGGSYMSLLSPHLEYLLSADPGNTALLKTLAEGSYQSQNLREAAKFYEKLSKLKPNDAVLEKRLGDTCAAIGDFGKAGFYYRRALRDMLKQSFRAPAKRAFDRKAIKETKALIRSLPRPEAYVWDLIQDEEYERAAAELKRYLARNPSDAWAMSVMGSIFEELDQDGAAERLYQKAMKVNPENPLPYFYWGRYLLLKKKEFWEALQAFEKYRGKLKESALRAEDPERKKKVTEYSTQAARYIASIYTETLNKPQFAAQVLEDAAKESPKNEEVYYDLGVVYMKLKKKMSSIQSFRKVMELKPDSKLAKEAERSIDRVRSMQDGDF